MSGRNRTLFKKKAVTCNQATQAEREVAAENTGGGEIETDGLFCWKKHTVNTVKTCVRLYDVHHHNETASCCSRWPDR